MVRWIALLIFCSFLFTGFIRPDLPRDSRGIYRLDGYTGPMLKTQSGGLFALAVGFKQNAVAVQPSQRQHAELLLDRLEAALADFDSNVAEITVGRIYATTDEIILSVEVRDATKLETVRKQIGDKLRALPGVLFVGNPGKVQLE